VVLGGIGLSGGRGGVFNVVVGTLLIGTIVNGMTIMNVSFEAQNLVKGMVLLAARNCSRLLAGLLRVGANGMVDGGVAA